MPVHDNSIFRVTQPRIQSLELLADIKTSFARSLVEKAQIDSLKPLQNNENIKNSKKDDDKTKNPRAKKASHESIKRDTQNEKKYEKLKSKIKIALQNESISNKVIKLVARALDYLILKQCNKADHSAKTLCKCNLQNEMPPVEKQQEFLNAFKDFDVDTLSFKDRVMFILYAWNKTLNILLKYSFNCSLQNHMIKDTVKEKQLRHESTDKLAQRLNITQGSCEEFKVCPRELELFLLRFHKTIKDAVADVFKNYAKMYIGDQTIDSLDLIDGLEMSAKGLLGNLSKSVDRKIRKVFKEELHTLRLDTGHNKTVNIRIMYSFIHITARRIQRHVRKRIPSTISPLRAKLEPEQVDDMKKDILNQLDVNLRRVEIEVKATLCVAFATCIDKFDYTRRFHKDSDRLSIKPYYSVFAKLQVNLDDRLRDDIVNFIIRSNRKSFNQKRDKIKKLDVMSKDVLKYSLPHFNITRTSVSKSAITIANVNEINKAA